MADGALSISNIGEEMMVVFSKEFGSEDPFVDCCRIGAFGWPNGTTLVSVHILALPLDRWQSVTSGRP